MLSLYRYFWGILKLELFGVYPEKVINLCEQQKISIWNISYKKGKIGFNITVRDFRRLPKLFKKQGVRLHIIKKSGLPFFTNKYKYRFGIFAGILIFFITLQVLSNFIWVIEVEGNKTVDSREILKVCEEIGIDVGISKKKLDSKNKVQDLLLKCDRLSWASMNAEGSRLTVNVTEITKKENDNSIACNLIADSDGIIKHIDVTMGNCVVKVGDTVSKGDVLVSGIIENEQGTKFVRSAGKIIAETALEVELSQAYSTVTTNYLGLQKNRYALEILGFKIPLYLGKIKGEYDSEYSLNSLKLFKREVPLIIHKRRFIFKESQKEKISYEKACEMLNERLEKEYPNAQKTREFFEYGDKAVLKAIIKEERDITKSQSLIFSVGK